MQMRYVIDRSVKGVLLLTALVSLLVLMLIGMFILREGLPAFRQIGLNRMFTSSVWRPTIGEFGMLGMVAGSIWATLGAIVLGVPLAVGCALLLAEVAPPSVHRVLRPSIELLAGIPSVVYGLYGMVVLVPLVRRIQVPGNAGFGVLSASVILAIMILPTVTSIAEDAIRAVPRSYREGSLALGATHWQTITGVILPSARSGIVAGIILGVGRALGETMAMIMVIGNSIIVPRPISNNPLTVVLSQTRTLTGNIALEISYATGLHESALFATGVILFVMIMLVNSIARWMLQGKRGT